MLEQGLPSSTAFASALALGLQANMGRREPVRPHSTMNGLPGGLIRLSPSKPVIIVPDLHARPSLVDALVGAVFPDIGIPLVEALAQRLATLLFLGDIPHAEGPEAARRWVTAYRELVSGGDERSILSPEMDEEMGLSIYALLKVIELQSGYPENVFCLKGNHDNMTNASDHGDFPFYKYADEGRMGALWLRMRYGIEIAHRVRQYELSLPIAAQGFHFCASHAEPAIAITEQMLLDYRDDPDVVRSLIWTANGEAEKGSVRESLEALLPSTQAAVRAVWFSGHRPVAGAFSLRAEGQLIQIHNPGVWQVVYLGPGEEGEARFFQLSSAGGIADETARLVLDPFARQK